MGRLGRLKLNLDNGANEVMQVLYDTYLGAAAHATCQGIVASSRFKRTYQDSHKICAKIKLVLSRDGRHSLAKLPAVFASAQLFEAAMLSGANRKLVLTAACDELGDL